MSNKKKTKTAITNKPKTVKEINAEAVLVGGGNDVSDVNSRLDLFVSSRIGKNRLRPSGKEEGDEETDQIQGIEFIQPMIEPSILTRLKALSGILGQCINATVNGVFGKGYRLPIRDHIPKGDRESGSTKDAIEKEKEAIIEFLENMDIDGDSHLKFRTKTGQNYVTTGNAYLEVIREPSVGDDGRLTLPEDGLIQNVGNIYAFQLLESINMRIAKISKQWIPCKNYIFRDGDWKEVPSIKRFKTFVQIDDPDSAEIHEHVYFKEFGDPRRIDEETGNEITDEKWNTMTTDEKEKFKPAKEVIFFKQYFTGTPYGVPVYIGALSAIVGSILKEENDLKWFHNGSKADLVVMSDAPLSETSVERIKGFIRESASIENARKALVLSPTQGPKMIGEKETAVKLQIKEINQNKDAQWVEYDKENRTKVKSTFLLSDLHIGLNQDFNRATSETALVVVEENVFKPMRLDYDYVINHVLFPAQGFVYHRYESMPSTKESLTTFADALYKLHLAGTTLRENRRLIEKVFDTELDDLDKKLGKDVAEKLLDVPTTVLKDLIGGGFMNVYIGEPPEPPQPQEPEGDGNGGESQDEGEDGEGGEEEDENGGESQEETEPAKQWFELTTDELVGMGWELVEEGEIQLSSKQKIQDIKEAGYKIHSIAIFEGSEKTKHQKQCFTDDEGITRKRISIKRF